MSRPPLRRTARRARALALPGLLLVAAPVACGGEETPASTEGARAPVAAPPTAGPPGPRAAGPAGPGPGPRPERPAPGPRPVATQVADTEVTLLEPGDAPQEPLRYAPRVGSAAVGALEIGARIRAGDAPSGSTPPITARYRVAIAEVDAQGFRTRATLDASSLPAESPLATGASSLDGVSVSTRIDTRGIVRELSYTLPPGAGPDVAAAFEQVRSVLAQLTVPLPEEPVGVGARWRLEQTVQGPVEAQQRTEVELVAREGDTLTLRTSLRQSVSLGEARLPGTPGAANAQLEAFEGRGEGQVRLPLDGLVPEEARSTLTTTTRLGAPPGAQGPLTLRVELTTRVNRAE